MVNDYYKIKNSITDEPFSVIIDKLVNPKISFKNVYYEQLDNYHSHLSILNNTSNANLTKEFIDCVYIKINLTQSKIDKLISEKINLERLLYESEYHIVIDSDVEEIYVNDLIEFINSRIKDIIDVISELTISIESFLAEIKDFDVVSYRKAKIIELEKAIDWCNEKINKAV